MTLDQVLFFVFGSAGLALLAVKFLDFIEKDAKSTWWIIAEGIYLNSLGERISSKRASGLTNYYAPLPSLVFTTIILQEQEEIKTIPTINIGNLPPPGTRIRILKNKRADFKIETVTA